MKPTLLLCVVVALSLTPALAADPPATAADTATAEKEIRTRAQDFSAAWKKHDPAAVAAFYTTDGELVTGQGRAFAGREAIQEAITGAFEGAMKDSTFVWTVEKVKLVKPDVAIVDYDAEIKGADAGAEALKFHIVAVLVKQGGKWLTQTTRGIVYQQ